MLTLAAALVSGNNLLYLLYGLIAAALLLSAAAAWLDLRSVRADAEFPERVFRGGPFVLRVRLRNEGRFSCWLPAIRWGRGQACCLDRLDPGAEGGAALDVVLPHRGRNSLDGLRLATSFPFGLIELSRTLAGAVGTALPRPREVRSPVELSADVTESGERKPRKGAGDELYGIRGYDPSDDARLINWKLTARTGKVLVNEYEGLGGSKVTVRVSADGTDDSSEDAVVEAASACRHFIDRGGTVRLVTREGEVGPGQGLAHLDRLLEALALLGRGRVPRPAPSPAAAAGPGAAGPRALFSAGTALVFGALILVEEIPPAWLAALTPLFLLAWAMDRGTLPRLPKLLWDVLSVAVLAFVLAVDWRWSGVTVANTHLILYLMFNRLLSALSPGETGQAFFILVLGFFLVSGQTISLWYFAFFLLFAAFSGAWLFHSRWREAGPGRPFPAGLLAGLLAAGLAVDGLVFAATPRIEPLRRMQAFAAMGLDKRRPRAEFVAQFTENVSLGFFGSLKQSGARVLRVRPLGNREDGAAAPWPALRVRGGSFDTLYGRRWSKTNSRFRYQVGQGSYQTAQGKAWTPRRGGRLLFPAERVPAAPEAEITVYPLASAVLFSLGSLSAVGEPRAGAWFDHTDTAYFGSSYLGGVQYQVYPGTARGFGPFIEGYDRLVRERFLQLPPGEDPRVRALSQRLIRDARSPREAVRAVEEHLRRDYAYSTYSRDASKDLAGFLFGDRTGNCEYFATAAVILLRHAGIPARLATGFLTEDWNEYGRFYDVRQAHAHAWGEALVDGRWLVVDGTPSGGDSVVSRALRARLERYFEALQFRWYRDVIGYDGFVQRNTFYRFNAALVGPQARLRLRQAALAAAALLVLAAAGWGARALWRRLRRPLPGRFDRALALLRRAGLRRLAHETPLEFARGAARRRPELEPLVDLVRLHYRERFAGRPLSADEAAQAERLLAGLTDAVRRPPD